MSRKILRDDETAEKQETTQTQETTEKLQEKLKSVKESVYSVKELSANSKKLFDTRQECVAAALKAAGKTECTVSEARKIVEKFLKKEVK